MYYQEWADILNRHRHRPTPPQGETEEAIDGGGVNVQWGANHEAPPSGHALNAGEPDGAPGSQPQEQCHEPEGQAEDIIDALLDNLHLHTGVAHEEEKDDSALLQRVREPTAEGENNVTDAERGETDLVLNTRDRAMDLVRSDLTDNERDAERDGFHNVTDAPQQGDKVAWVQGRKRKRNDRDPENHTDHGDSKDEVETEEAREECRGPPTSAATDAEVEGANDVDLEEQRRIEDERDEERVLQEDFEQDRALHEEWIQKTIDDYFADVEEEQPGPSRQRPGRQQEEGVKLHADAVTAAFDI